MTTPPPERKKCGNPYCTEGHVFNDDTHAYDICPTCLGTGLEPLAERVEEIGRIPQGKLTLADMHDPSAVAAEGEKTLGQILWEESHPISAIQAACNGRKAWNDISQNERDVAETIAASIAAEAVRRSEDTKMRHILENQIDDQADEIEALKREVEEKDAEIEKLKFMFNASDRGFQIASDNCQTKDATILELRVALEKMLRLVRDEDWNDYRRWIKVAEKALRSTSAQGEGK